MTAFRALVLAGSRPGDRLALASGAPAKVLVPLAGRPLLAWVLDALRAAPSIGRIAVAIDHDTDLGMPPVERLATAETPEASVLRALDHMGEDGFPLVLTTGDHALLSVPMIEHFCAAVPDDADAAVGLAPASVIRAAYPRSRRTYYRLGEESYSGCNLYCLAHAGRAPSGFDLGRARTSPQASMAPGLGDWAAYLDRLLTGAPALVHRHGAPFRPVAGTGPGRRDAFCRGGDGRRHARRPGPRRVHSGQAQGGSCAVTKLCHYDDVQPAPRRTGRHGSTGGQP